MALYQSTHTGLEIDEAIDKVSTIEQAVITNTEDITTIEETLGTLEGSVGDVASDLGTHTSDETIHHTIDELDVLYEPKNSNIPAHIADATKHIDTTTAEFSGTLDETNDKFTIWDNSLLKWIRFSFTNLKTFIGTYFLKLDQTTPQTISQSPKINDLEDGKLMYVDKNNQIKTINGFYDPVKDQIQIGTATGYNSGYGLTSQKKIISSGAIEFSSANGILSDATLTVTKTVPFTIKNINTGSNSAIEIWTKNIKTATFTPTQGLNVVGGIQCGDDTAAASADKVGTTRYRATANASYVEMCMQVGASSYSWVAIVTNTW